MAMLYLKKTNLVMTNNINLLLLIESGRIDVGHSTPLGHGLRELLEGVVDHQLGLLPLEVGLHDPVPQLLVLVQQLLQLILLSGAVLAAKYSLKQLILFCIQT